MKQLVNYLLFLCIGCSFSFFYDIQLYRLLALLAAIILASLSYLFTRHSYMLYVYVLFGVLAAMQQSFLCYLPLLLYCVSRQHFSIKGLLFFFRCCFSCEWGLCFFAASLPYSLCLPYCFASNGRTMRK